MAKSKKNFTHQVVYSENNHIVVTATKGWAREHKTFFKNSFVGKDVPRTTKIEKALSQAGFSHAVSPEMIIYYEFKK